MSHSPPTPREASKPSNAMPAFCSARAAASPDGPAPITAYRCSCIVLPLLAEEERAQGLGDLRPDVGIRDRRLAVACLRAVGAEARVVAALDLDEDRIGGQQVCGGSIFSGVESPSSLAEMLSAARPDSDRSFAQ